MVRLKYLKYKIKVSLYLKNKNKKTPPLYKSFHKTFCPLQVWEGAAVEW